MSNHNYSQYSNKNKNNNRVYEPKIETTPVEPVIEDIVETIVEPVVEVNETVVETVIEPIVEQTPVVEPEPQVITGTVANCVKLNVRANPKADADVVCVLDANSEMKIDMTKSNKEWFHVNTAAGVDGYCMRKFVNVK